MSLPKETQERIKADAEDYALPMAWVNQNPKGEEQLFYEYISSTSYIAGATAEATNAESIRLQLEAQDANVEILLQQKKEVNERVQKLVDALKIISDLKSFTDKEGFVKQVADNALQQWNAGDEPKFEGSVITEPIPGIALGCISPEARELLDTIMEQWGKHYTSMKEMHGDAMPETTFYGFAYWLVRWSGLVQPTNTNPPK